MRNRHRSSALISAALALPLGALACGPALAVKKAPYPEVKVSLAEAFQPDEAFRAMRTALNAAISSKNTQALFALVHTMFIWTVDGALSQDFNPGESAIDNFKVVFGFRAPGAAKDGGVENGPFWDDLAFFAADNVLYKDANVTNLVCGPMLAEAQDDDAFDKAEKKVATPGEPTIWYFTLAETTVKASPDQKAAAVGKVGTVALPLLSIYPAQQGNAPPPPTFFEVLLPSGKSGWVPASAARPMEGNRLCYAKDSSGKWKIVLFDEASE